MSTSFEIISKVTEYVERDITLWELESWLVTKLPTYLDNPESTEGKLAVLVDLCLAELHDGIRAERGVRSVLAKYTAGLRLRWFEYPPTESSTLTSASSSPNPSRALLWPDQSPSWSTGYVGASA